MRGTREYNQALSREAALVPIRHVIATQRWAGML